MIESKEIINQGINIPEKSFQDSQKVTEQVAKLSERAAKAEAEVKAMKERLEKESKNITVTLKKGGDKVVLHDMMWGTRTIDYRDLDVQSIDIKNVDEADKFLTTVLESEIAQERDELQKKYEALEIKLDKKDRDITNRDRELTRISSVHSDMIDDIESANSKELTKIRKTAKGKVEKQLVAKDVEFAQLTNQVELERQEANLRETELLGNLDHYKQANDVLEARVSELEKAPVKLTGVLGDFINKMTGYKKAQNKLANFNVRNRSGRSSYKMDPFTISW